MISAFWIVLNLWAIALKVFRVSFKHSTFRDEETHIVVRPFAARSNASWTTLSDCESKAEVASSKRRTLGFLIRARAMAMRCF